MVLFGLGKAPGTIVVSLENAILFLLDRHAQASFADRSYRALFEQKRTDPCRTSHPMILTRMTLRVYRPPAMPVAVAKG